MIPGGYLPVDRPKTAQELEPGTAHELHDGVATKSGKGAWITLAVVVILILGVIMLLSFLPDPPASVMTTTVPPLEAPVG
jgi:hypothetical protein